jgi:formyl-CoA transferase
VLAVTENLVTEYASAGYVRERTGPTLPNIAPSNVYPTRDGINILIAANQDTVFSRLCEAMNRPDLVRDERYATHAARGANQVELDGLLSEWTATLAASDLEVLLDRHSVPAGRIYRAPEMLADPHFAAREAIIRLAHPHFGELAMQNVFPRLSETPGSVRRPGPELGEDNRAILGGMLGLEDAEIGRLVRLGVVSANALPTRKPAEPNDATGQGALLAQSGA